MQAQSQNLFFTFAWFQASVLYLFSPSDTKISCINYQFFHEFTSSEFQSHSCVVLPIREETAALIKPNYYFYPYQAMGNVMW
ncbi:hypothetical protein METHB2_150017 [Candidatus Methylobacter favarea]|uniref:Uncharacterized protein n=1 Tax=Candidatus Methylobacter favarea TaxID=2707345 RepID=A0A8S0XHN6_9GAMM|nr:hypothetical protein METHB2_150017 [Candidatus Methylobacter favarea]